MQIEFLFEHHALINATKYRNLSKNLKFALNFKFWKYDPRNEEVNWNLCLNELCVNYGDIYGDNAVLFPFLPFAP